ncbi:hypothetical protein SAMN04489722_11145 [Algibacter lectus]|uniref:hypothetical protein n=1 Tax=Algibacter lectus TaxID=221126 RepID=UPI0008DF2084|nr:hypothetical protein [Algibacter lectus]SFD51778.1 hypothetical protein SAMN04489722_11145 [Algibacter lectus]
MNSILKSISLAVILLLIYNCSNDDALTSTGNTDEYFKYTVNNGVERVFDSQAKGWFTSNTNSVYQKFFFRAGAETASGSSPIIDGSFTFQDFSTFTSTTNFGWGVSDGVTSNFYFTDVFAGNMFISSTTNLPSTPIMCTVTAHPVIVGDYIEFTFSGDYIDALDPTIQGYVEGEGRVLREMDQ